jgi:hypothetical protein
LSGRSSTSNARLADLADAIRKVGDEIKIAEEKIKISNQASSQQLQMDVYFLNVDMQQLSEMLIIEQSTPAGPPEVSPFTKGDSIFVARYSVICCRSFINLQ